MNKLIVYLLFLLINFTVRSTFPNYFFNDEINFLDSLKAQDLKYAYGHHFINFFYHAIPINFYGKEITYLLIVNIILLAIINKYIQTYRSCINYHNVILLMYCSIFLSFIGKDIFTIIFTIYLLFSGKKIIFKTFIFIFFSLAISRYYLIIPLLNYLFIRALKIKNKTKIIFYSLLSYLSIFSATEYFFNKNIFLTRESLTTELESKTNINTLIYNLNYFDSNIFNDILNYLYSIITLTIAPLIYAKEITVSICLFNIFIIYLLSKILLIDFYSKNCINNKIFIFITGYLLTLFVFEPDLGSFARHLCLVATLLLLTKNSSCNKR